MNANAKKLGRIRRARKSRAKMRELGVTRLCVFRSAKHIYAQIISNKNDVVAQASTLDNDLRSGSTGNQDAATSVGKLIAERAKAAGIESVAFDRSGFMYHGRVKALAEAAREAGLKF